MSPSKCLLVVLWSSSLFNLSSGFQELSSPHVRPSVSRSRTTTRLYDVPEPLAEEDNWQAFLDEETTGLVYYFDTATGESLWEPPTSTFPPVRLPRRKQRLADNLRREYRKTRQEVMSGDSDYESSESGVGRILSSVTSVLEQEVEETAEEQEQLLDDSQTEEDEEQPTGWFNNFFNDGVAEKETIDDTASLEEEKPQKGFFGNIFGGGSASVEVEDEGAFEETTDDQEDENKNGLLGSFAAPFSNLVSPSTTTSTDDVEKQEKIVDLTPQAIKIEMGSHILPHPAKVRWGGEDATFIKGRTFGVFDGVSGAEKLDGVPLYSRTLANEMKKMCGTSGETVQDMTTYMASAASYADDSATGASTAVVASIGENGFLQALNVGDSCCMVVREGKITAKTREISHYWECPYQLSEDSPDQPKDGTKLNVELIPGDVIIMGSDGVFDNVNDGILLDLVAESSVVRPTSLAKKICDVSRKISLDKTAVTPYSLQARRRGDADYRDGLGGKVDDVSCIIVVCK